VKSSGFSLIEVSLAILLVGIGLLSLFSLFPLALKESDLAIEDTQEALFADHVLSGIWGNAMAIDSWSAWSNVTSFTEGIYPVSSNMVVAAHNQYVAFPEPEHDAVARPLRYRLTITPMVTDSPRKTVRLEVKSGRYGVFTNAQVFFSELIFMGM